MTAYTGFVDNSVEVYATYALLALIKQKAELNGWTTLRYDVTSANRELILKGVGLSGTEEIYIGFRCYQSIGADYYNMTAAVFTAYIAGNTFLTQPGVALSAFPCHNLRIDYWLSVNAQRITGGLKVGTPIYVPFYAGKFLPYTLPTQWPYPVAVGGMFLSEPATRYSDTAQSIPYKGNRSNFLIRKIDGVYASPYAWPFTAQYNTRDTGTIYPLMPIVLHNNSSTIYGELDGIYYISGFQQGVENTLVIGGVTYVVMQDVYRTGFSDYFAIRMS